MHSPLWKLARIAEGLIEVKALHTISTGYAGFLGALLRQSRDIPLILSEHGIYTKERKIELFKSEWIRDNRNVFQRDPTELSYFRQMWIHFFEWLGALLLRRSRPHRRPLRAEPPAPDRRRRTARAHPQCAERDRPQAPGPAA